MPVDGSVPSLPTTSTAEPTPTPAPAPEAKQQPLRNMTPPDSDETSLPLASWQQRSIAFLLDAAILFVVFAVSLWVVVPVLGNLDLNHEPSATFAEVFNSYLSALFTTLIWVMLFMLVIWGGLLEGCWGRTPGKAAMRLKVVSANDHNLTIGFWGGTAREIVRSIPFLYVFLNETEFFADMRVIPEAAAKISLLSGLGLVFLIDHFWLQQNKESQTLHDKFANSHIVSTRQG